MNRPFLIVFITLAVVACSVKQQSNLTFERLLVEYAEDPITIDEQHPRFSWIINSSERNKQQTAYQILVATEKKKLKAKTADVWNSGKVVSAETIQHELRETFLQSNQKYFWKVIVWDEKENASESPVATFETALFNASDWQAKWIGKTPEFKALPEKGFITHRDEQATMKDTVNHSGQSLLLRKEVNLSKKIESAKAFVTGLGFYEFYINGQKVGDHVLAPAKTPYHENILYNTYDVTTMLRQGENALGMHVGNGWYNPYKPWWQQYRMQWFGHKKAIAQVHVTYTDGSEQVLKTDESWLQSDGPITFSCVYDGEVYDASLDQRGWNSVGFDASKWQPVTVFNSIDSRLVSETMPPMRVIQTIKPDEIKVEKENMRVFDMGQNFSGWVRIKAKGKKGTKIRMRFSEDIYEDGTIDVTSTEQAKASAEFILKGEGVESYEPKFTYFGFKYVEVTAENGSLDLENIEGCVVYSDNKLVGDFKCDNELVNKLHRATVWSQKSNMLGYPMDCPQRDERLGWFGDAQVTAEEAMFNFNMPLFYENWFAGIRDNQDEATGDIPIISPQPYILDEGVEWSSTYITMLWDYYRYYGDKRILAGHYLSMKRYMEFLDNVSTDFIAPRSWIGDWGSLVKDRRAGELDATATAFYYFNATILSKVAAILDKKADQQHFEELAANIREAYNKNYFNAETGNYTNGCQMSNAFPLFLGLVPERSVEKVQENLVYDIEVTNDNHLTTGVIGTKYMPEALAAFGRTDVVWNLINQTTYPSWNSMMEKYTTVCEFWTLKQSKNHVMMGSIDAWFYKYIAGIQLDEDNPAYAAFQIKPYLLDGLSYAEAKTETMRGLVSSKWKNEGGTLTLEVKVPFNTSATVYLPAEEGAKITEAENQINEVEGVKYHGYSEGRHQLLVNSGQYQFKAEK
ncbi:family 78 glycoside hydrolase catalytic domain [Prolixibacteraceae bacterium Z1-6]|uniref:alpha-L-rhamnosidase n=1 Tax=Draconibacterium aestuarii TaxID=2998507 RepID=A0A9X3F452_9BACT|nr:family 78 glycoside hydrolase catalytic domain [Prolixibacteraceae bacterium Z1-6]